MAEPDNRLIEAVVAFSEFEDKIKSTGLNFDLHAAFWDQGPEVKCMYSSSDPIAKQRTLQGSILADGNARLLEVKKEVFPANADLHPENARMIFSTGSVYYTGNETAIPEDVFSEFEEIFKFGTKIE